MADEIISELSHMGSLTAALTFLLAEASGLPDPQSVTVCGILSGHVHDEVTLHFPSDEASTQALALWALRFGGVVQSHVGDLHGAPTLWVRLDFTWQEFLHVDAFAAIPLPETEAITAAEQDSAPEPALPS